MGIFSKTLLCFFILYIVHFTLYIPVAFAQVLIESGQESTPSSAFNAQSIGSSKLDPSSPLYFLKAVREILEIKFAGTEKVRVLRRLEFAERRLREVNSLIAVGRENLVQPNVEKFLLELSLIGRVGDDSLHLMINRSLGHYMETLVALYGNLTNARAKLGVRSAIYRLMDFNRKYYTDLKPALSDQIFPPQASKFALGCSLLDRESKNLSLNESERQVLEERGKRCNETITSIFKHLEDELQKNAK